MGDRPDDATPGTINADVAAISASTLKSCTLALWRSSLSAARTKDDMAKASKVAKERKAPVVEAARSGAKKAAQPAARLYSNFSPIPLLLPCPVPIASSSSKPVKYVTHHTYVRPHHSKRKVSFSDDDAAEDTDARTIFAVNLPVDMTERDLRAVFGSWGVVESIKFNDSISNSALEDAVRGMSPEDSDEELESDAEEAAADEQDQSESAGPTFVPNFPEKRRRRRRPDVLASIPEVASLPSLDPRQTPLGASGLRAAHITYLDPLSVSRAMTHPASKPIPIPSYGAEPTGLAYYDRLHRALRPPLNAVKEYADSAMARFDALHGMLLSSRAKKQGAGALVDEDGFTVVVRGGRYGRTGGRGSGDGALGVGVAKRGFGKDQEELEKGKGQGAKELVDFYRFQKKERKQKGEPFKDPVRHH